MKRMKIHYFFPLNGRNPIVEMGFNNKNKWKLDNKVYTNKF